MNDSEHGKLVDRIAESGALGVGWRGAFLRTPRSPFVPERIWIENDPNGYRSITRHDDPGAWWAEVNADGVVVTQLDDGADDGPGVATSSVSMPTLVARMMTELDLRPSHSVLEIGSGWSTGLLCARVGQERVVSVEIDAEVAARAGSALASIGRHPVLITGDGTQGFPGKAPYDRVSSTAAVARVPHAWVEQCAPGGIIVTPWGTPFCNAGLLKLHVGGKHKAIGRFVGSVNFMWVRSQRPATTAPTDDRSPSRYGPSVMEPRLALESVHCAFAVGLHVPAVRYREVWNEKDAKATRRIVLWDGKGSEAAVFHDGWQESDAVRQKGPRNLWTEVTEARTWWEAQGRPELTRFGLSVQPDVQTVWLDHPGNTVTTVQSRD